MTAVHARFELYTFIRHTLMNAAREGIRFGVSGPNLPVGAKASSFAIQQTPTRNAGRLNHQIGAMCQGHPTIDECKLKANTYCRQRQMKPDNFRIDRYLKLGSHSL